MPHASLVMAQTLKALVQFLGWQGSMPHIATQLSPDQIEELASYLSFVK